MRRTAFVLLFAAALLAPAAEADRPFTSHRGIIAFDGVTQGPGDGVYLALPDGSGLRRVVKGKHYAAPAWPAVAPDGVHVAFSDRGAGAAHIYTVKSDRTHLRQVTKGQVLDYFPSYSPNGRKIVFISSSRSNEGWELFTVRADGTGLRQLTHEPFIETAGEEFSPDGTRIAFAYTKGGPAKFQIGVVKANGSGFRRVTSPKHPENTDPSWSPNGHEIVYASQLGIDSIRPDGTHHKALVRGPGRLTQPTVSPDGKSIAYVASGHGLPRHVLRRVPIRGGKSRRINTGHIAPYNPDWGPPS